MADLNGLKVMIIDDSSTIARAAQIFLSGQKEPTGIITTHFEDGYLAIPQLKLFQPDIILLDVMMPRSNGYDICQAIKRKNESRHIKVIMMTSKSGLFDRARGAEAKADDYIVKPFQRDGLLEVIRKHAPEKFQ